MPLPPGVATTTRREHDKRCSCYFRGSRDHPAKCPSTPGSVWPYKARRQRLRCCILVCSVHLDGRIWCTAMANVDLSAAGRLQFEPARAALRMDPGIGGARIGLSLRVTRQDERKDPPPCEVTGTVFVGRSPNLNLRFLCDLRGRLPGAGGVMETGRRPRASPVWSGMECRQV
jgi:hypothetical protein